MKAAYRKDGFVVLEGLVAEAALDACEAEFRAIFEAAAARFGIGPAAGPRPVDLTPVMTALFRADMAAYLAAAKLAQHAVALHRLGTDPALMAALRDLGLELPVISTRPVMFLMADALKVPGGYHKTPPHQDWRSIQGSLDSVVVWIPFTDVGPGHYPLEVAPSSHRRGLLPSVEDAFGHRLADGIVDAAEFRPLSVARGDAVVFSTLLVHRTGESGGPEARFAASFRYNNALEPSFVARSYPNPYVYRPDMTLIEPVAASPEAAARTFGR
jgi:ectoine hydroxylase-related dioxygenase (phytanoyl-CoA dioxygenase family)